MEYRHYIIIAVAIFALQVFIYITARTIFWLWSDKLSLKAKRATGIGLYLLFNGIIALTLLRIYPPLFRISAGLLVLLLFISFISLSCLILFRLGKVWFNPHTLNLSLKIAYPFALISLLSLSIYNAYTPKIIHYNITLNKPLKHPLRIGMVSDLHLGILFGANQLDKLANIMQQQQVDIILMPGDIMDDNVDAYLAQNMQPHLAKLTAPLGVYATLGNHDFFGHDQAIYRELTQAGIKVLRDESLNVQNQFILIGRNDDLVRDRPSTADLLQDVNTHIPIILLDHRPTEITQHAQLPIDIQLSGHTHKGQIFPANLITKMMYVLDYGYQQINQGHFFVSSGYGFWGIPMRLGSQSEVLIIDVKGKNSAEN